jgi:hypothetical protein
MSKSHIDLPAYVQQFRELGSVDALARARRSNRVHVLLNLRKAVARGLLRPAELEYPTDAAVRPSPVRQTNPEQEALQVLHDRRENSKQQALLRASQTEVSQLEAELEAVRQQNELLMALDQTRRYGQIPRYDSTKGQAVPVLILSDLHVDEVVDPAQVPGCANSYNPEIAKSRIRKAFQHGLFMVETMRNMAKIDTMCLALLGDLISGEIHEELAATNAMTPIQAVVYAQELLGEGIEYLLQHGNFNKIVIPCSYGNHDRIHKQIRTKDGAANSYSWLIYNMLAKQFRSEKRLDWHIATGYHNYIKFWDTTIRFHHGDAINYGGGVGGITIPIRKAIAQWNTVCPATVDCLAHFHQMLDGGDFVCNGTTVGFSEYALRIKARFERPRQVLALIDQKRGKTLTSEVFVE